MKRLGLVARADNGGIANQTWQFARRMKPEEIEFEATWRAFE